MNLTVSGWLFAAKLLRWSVESRAVSMRNRADQFIEDPERADYGCYVEMVGG